MNCEWRQKADLYVDNELDPASQQEVARHLLNCAECAAVVMDQHEFKKTVRVAGKRFSAPPDPSAGKCKSVVEAGAGNSVHAPDSRACVLSLLPSEGK